MSRHPDPCYCEQAAAYEALLREALPKLPRGLLRSEIRETIREYRNALAEYNNEDVDPTPWCQHCGPEHACDCKPSTE